MMLKKKRKAVILILMMVMMISSMVFAAENNDYILVGQVEANGEIGEGDTVLLKLDVTSKGNFSNVKVYVSGDFSLVLGAYYEIGNLDNGQHLASLPIQYDGSGNKLSILVDDGQGHSIVQQITVSNVEETVTSVPSPNPVDPNRFFPEFNLYLQETIPTFNAGTTKVFTFDLENRSSYYGQNVSVELVHDENFPFDDTVNSLITEAVVINKYERHTYSMEVKTRKSIPSGFYDIPIKIHAKNIYGVDISYDKVIQVEIISDENPPNVVVHGITQDQAAFVPGTDGLFQIALKNFGSMDARNVRVTLEDLDVDGITLNGDSAIKSADVIKAKSVELFTYKIHISEDLDTKKEALKVMVTFHDEYGETYSQELPLYLDIAQSSEDLSDVTLNLLSYPSNLTPEDEFTVPFEMTNTSGSTMNHLKITLKTEANFIRKSDSVIIIDTLEAGATIQEHFTMIVPQGMSTNNYPNYIVIEDALGNTKEYYFGIFVDGDTATSSKPKIIIDAYDYGGETILAGQTFDLAITFFNTSNTMGIRNAKVAITTDEGAFVPVNSASSFYIESIGIKEKVTHTITMKAKADLNVKTYNVTADIEYEDSNGNSYDKNNQPYQANESMAIPVMQELRLEVEEINVSPFIPMFQPTEVFVEFFNMGKSPLANMMVRTEGDFEIQDGKYFVGNFAPGANDYYTCNIIPLNPGMNTGKVIFEFEDAVGEKHLVEKSFEFESMEVEMDYEVQPPGEFPDGMDPFNPEGEMMPEGKSNMKFIIFGLLGLALVVVLVLVRRKIKKKKEMMFNE